MISQVFRSQVFPERSSPEFKHLPCRARMLVHEVPLIRTYGTPARYVCAGSCQCCSESLRAVAATLLRDHAFGSIHDAAATRTATQGVCQLHQENPTLDAFRTQGSLRLGMFFSLSILSFALCAAIVLGRILRPQTFQRCYHCGRG